MGLACEDRTAKSSYSRGLVFGDGREILSYTKDGMLFESCCSGGLRPPMGNDSALIETPLQMKSVR